ncbi:MAG: chorismate-binding protein, partial [Planctomycetota bacterium]
MSCEEQKLNYRVASKSVGPQFVEHAFRSFTQLPNAIFLDGNGEEKQFSRLNRFSFMAADPVDCLILRQNDVEALQKIRMLVKKYPTRTSSELPPFQGGVAGLIGYDFNTCLEDVASPKYDEFNVPKIALYVYDVVLAIDNHAKTAWLVAQQWHESNSACNERLNFFQRVLDSGPSSKSTPTNSNQNIDLEAPLHKIPQTNDLYSDFSKSEFLNMVSAAVEYIRAGDIFQVNLSQRLLTPATKSSPDLYLGMRRANPAPFSGYLDFGCGQLISASPERLVNVNERQIETRPIKGTRIRTHFP